ncbi:MAG: hypothetical protein WHS44_05575 [Fimbriimonadales bacterium]
MSDIQRDEWEREGARRQYEASSCAATTIGCIPAFVAAILVAYLLTLLGMPQDSCFLWVVMFVVFLLTLGFIHDRLMRASKPRD